MRSSALMTRTATRPQLFAQAGRRSFAKAGLTKPNIGIAGATGAVGKEIMGCIEKLDFPYSDIKMWAHPDEAGGTIDFMGKTYTLEAIGDGCFDDVDIALFSAGGDISKNFAPVAAAAGCVVVDNSSEFRMDPNCPLVVPEVNGHAVAGHNGIIANPNCTTILMNVPVYPLHKVRHPNMLQPSTATGTPASRAQLCSWACGAFLRPKDSIRDSPPVAAGGGGACSRWRRPCTFLAPSAARGAREAGLPPPPLQRA